LVREGARADILVVGDHPLLGDGILSTHLYDQLKCAGEVRLVPYDANPVRTFRRFYSADVVLTTRLHPAIFAYSVHKPFLLWNYHEKCADFVERIAGPGWSLLSDTSTSSDVTFLLRRALAGQWEPPRLDVAAAVRLAERSVCLPG
jgi:polysaccharide pyruvyl transferase WcaK-like protein